MKALGNIEEIGKPLLNRSKTSTLQYSVPDHNNLDFAEHARRNGCVVIDNSSAFRMEKSIPLVIPEINEDALDNHAGIVANPNCSTAITLMGYFHYIRDGLKILCFHLPGCFRSRSTGFDTLENELEHLWVKTLNHHLYRKAIPPPYCS